MLTVAGLVGGVSHGVESIHGFAPYSFMKVIENIIEQDDPDKFFVHFCEPTLEELARIYLLGFQTVLRKTELVAFRSRPTAPVNFFGGITEHIGNATDIANSNKLDEFLENTVFKASTLPPHEKKMESWVLLPEPLKEHLHRVQLFLRKAHRANTRAGQREDVSGLSVDQCGYHKIIRGGKTVPAFKTSSTSIITKEGKLKSLNGNDKQVTVNPMSNAESLRQEQQRYSQASRENNTAASIEDGNGDADGRYEQWIHEEEG